MNRSWYGAEDPGLTGKLLAELPGVLLWSVGGATANAATLFNRRAGRPWCVKWKSLHPPWGLSSSNAAPSDLTTRLPAKSCLTPTLSGAKQKARSPRPTRRCSGATFAPSCRHWKTDSIGQTATGFVPTSASDCGRDSDTWQGSENRRVGYRFLSEISAKCHRWHMFLLMHACAAESK